MSIVRMRVSYRGQPPGKPPTVLQKVLAVIVGAGVLAAALLFSVVVLAVVVTVGVIGGGYLWWRTRAVRRQLREQVAAMQATAAEAQARAEDQRSAGEIIDGEYSRVPAGDGERQARPQQEG